MKLTTNQSVVHESIPFYENLILVIISNEQASFNGHYPDQTSHTKEGQCVKQMLLDNRRSNLIQTV